MPLIIRLPDRTRTRAPAILRETSGGNQLLDGSISLSPLYPSQDERFARQYRCGPPPEFPLASPRSGIVHHLSGPDRHAHTRTPSQKIKVGRRCTPLGGSRQSASLRLAGFTHPLTRTHVRLLGPCFKTGRMGCPQAVPGARRYIAETARAANHDRRDGNLHEPIDSSGFGRRTNPHRSTPRVDRRTGYRRSTSDRDASPAPIRFPPDNFKHSLTLFQSPFHLSLAYLFAIGHHAGYLALDGNLPPYWGCIPKQPDSQTAPRGATGSGTTGLSPSLAPPFQGTWARSAAEDASPDYNSDSEAVRFSSWADPGSLAVTKGILVSFFSSAY
ncbi:hypothetical protein L1887_63523 [Cichorium endivia]|nr:hypothetical protein L1887_63523 [Cichorium endivia]